jgi:hypothetical protein
VGSLDADGLGFAFRAEAVFSGATDAPNTASEVRSTCVIARVDRAAGVLDDAEAASAFQGVLEYAFSSQGAADCGEVMATEGLATLPCTIGYRMTGTRIGDR